MDSFLKVYSQRKKIELSKCVQMFKNMQASNQIDGHITQGLEELKFTQLSKLLFNFKTGNWYNSKQHVVWDADYFSRHA